MICQDEYQTYRHKGTEFLSRSFITGFLHAFVPPLLELSILADALSLPAKGGIKPARPYPLFRPTTPSFPRSGRVKGKVGRNRGRSNGRSSPQMAVFDFSESDVDPHPPFTTFNGHPAQQISFLRYVSVLQPQVLTAHGPGKGGPHLIYMPLPADCLLCHAASRN